MREGQKNRREGASRTCLGQTSLGRPLLRAFNVILWDWTQAVVLPGCNISWIDFCNHVNCRNARCKWALVTWDDMMMTTWKYIWLNDNIILRCGTITAWPESSCFTTIFRWKLQWLKLSHLLPMLRRRRGVFFGNWLQHAWIVGYNSTKNVLLEKGSKIWVTENVRDGGGGGEEGGTPLFR